MKTIFFGTKNNGDALRILELAKRMVPLALIRPCVEELPNADASDYVVEIVAEDIDDRTILPFFDALVALPFKWGWDERDLRAPSFQKYERMFVQEYVEQERGQLVLRALLSVIWDNLDMGGGGDATSHGYSILEAAFAWIDHPKQLIKDRNHSYDDDPIFAMHVEMEEMPEYDGRGSTVEYFFEGNGSGGRGY